MGFQIGPRKGKEEVCSQLFSRNLPLKEVKFRRHAPLGWSLHGLDPLEKVTLGWGCWEHIAEMSNALIWGSVKKGLGLELGS